MTEHIEHQIDAMNQQVVQLHQQGDFEQALALAKQALALAQKTFGGDHPEVATACHNLGSIYEGMGDIQAALSLVEQALAIRQRSLPLNHPDVAQSMNVLNTLHRVTYQAILEWVASPLDKEAPEMSISAETDHISVEELADYVGACLSESRLAEIEWHLTVCEDCALRASPILQRASIWEQWTAATHLQALHQVEAFDPERLVEALEQAKSREGVPSLSGRLEHWLTNWSGRAQAAVRLVLSSASQVPNVVVKKLKTQVPSIHDWGIHLGKPSAFAGEPLPVVDGSRRLLRGGSRDTLDRSTPQATTETTPGDTSKSGRPVPATPQVYLEISPLPEGRPPETPRDILVSVLGITQAKQDARPLILLFIEGRDDVSWVAELKPGRAEPGDDGSSVLKSVAMFADIPPGEYVVAFEPHGQTAL